MRNFIISVEAACDLDEKTIKENDIRVAQMKYMIGDEEFISSNNEQEINQVCKKMQEGFKTSTTQISPLEAEEYLQKLLEEKCDILHISFSSYMSGTCNNFKNVAKELNEKNENKVYVVDSLCQAGGISLLVLMLLNEIKTKNLNIHQAIEYLEKTKQNIGHYFTVDNLKYLARGGRIASATAFIGNLIQIKPLMQVDDNCVIIPNKKVLGRKKAIIELFNIMKQKYNKASEYVVISHADCKEDALALSKLIEDYFNVKPIILPLSLVVITHGGPGALSLFFTVDKR